MLKAALLSLVHRPSPQLFTFSFCVANDLLSRILSAYLHPFLLSSNKPNSPRVVRESTRSKRRHLPVFSSSRHSSNSSEEREKWEEEEEDPDFLPPTPFRTRKKQKIY